MQTHICENGGYMFKLDLNDFLLALSYTIDFVEMDILGVTSNHSKRVAYISLNLAKEIGLSDEECFDIVALSILHDNGVSESIFHSELNGTQHERLKFLEQFKDHCVIGEKNIKNFPFLTDVSNVIRYHHERYDGSGYFGISGEDIPIMAQIIALADLIDLEFNLKESYLEKEDQLLRYVREATNKWFSSRLVNAFFAVIKKTNFQLDLMDELIDKVLLRKIYTFVKRLNYEEIRNMTKVFSRIIDCKSKFTAQHSLELSEKVAQMSEYYNKSDTEKLKLMIAADLHDIGKLAIPNAILDKPGRISVQEFTLVKTHTYYTRMCLQSLNGFEDITEWASNHHEKLNGQGYPNGFKTDQLDFNSRLLACLDIYQALTEDRPYKQALSHEESIKILQEMSEQNLIDEAITKDLDTVFKKKVMD